MKRLFLLFSYAALAAAQIQDISGDRIRAHTRFLSSDLMEGRAPGTRGDTLATDYLATQFALLGVKPAGDSGTYFQKVPLVGIEPQASSKLSVAGKGPPAPLRWLEDFVGVNQRQKPLEQFEAEAVFVGHGIVAPEFQWNDFKGTDVHGKMLVLFTNEPDSTDPKFRSNT